MANEVSDILIGQGLIDAEKLKRAQLYAKQNNTTVQEAIIRFGFATEEQVTAALAKHFSLPYASKENGILNPERDQDLQKLIPEKFARENLVVPLFIEDNELAAAFFDPSNLFLIDNYAVRIFQNRFEIGRIVYDLFGVMLILDILRNEIHRSGTIQRNACDQIFQTAWL